MDPNQRSGNRGQKRGRSTGSNEGDNDDEETKEAPQPIQPQPPPQQAQAILSSQHTSNQASSTTPIDLDNPLVRQILQLQNADPSRNQFLLQTLSNNLNPQPNQNLLANLYPQPNQNMLANLNPQPNQNMLADLNPQPQQQLQQQLSNIFGVPARPTPPNIIQGRGGLADADLLRSLLSGGDTQLQNLLPQQRQQEHELPSNLQAVLLQLVQAQQSQHENQPQQGNLPQAALLQLQQNQQSQQQQSQQGNFPQVGLRQLQAFELQRQLSAAGRSASSTSASMPQSHNNQLLAAIIGAAISGGSASLPQQIQPPAAASLPSSRPNPPDISHGLVSAVASPPINPVAGIGMGEPVGSPRASAPSAGNESITGRPPRVMYNETDEGRLTPYQCLARKHLEYFEADMDKVEEGAQGRNKAIVLGQVGIRCRFCSHLKRKEKAPAAAFYPSKLSGIYQSAQNIINSHLAKDCKNVPAEVREELLRLGNRKSAPGGGKAYWAEEAIQVGVIEDDNGLRFAQGQLAPAVAPAAAAGRATGVDGQD